MQDHSTGAIELLLSRADVEINSAPKWIVSHGEGTKGLQGLGWARETGWDVVMTFDRCTEDIVEKMRVYLTFLRISVAGDILDGSQEFAMAADSIAE